MTVGKQSYLSFVRGAFWASMAFSAVLAILLIATTIQVHLHEPLNSPALASMVEQAKQEPGNAELKAELRALDLLARKAYFTSLWQLRTGGILLIVGVTLSLFLWKAHAFLQPTSTPLPQPATPQSSWWAEQSGSRKLLAYAGIAVVFIAAASTFFVQGHLAGVSRSPSQQPALSSQRLSKGWPAFRGPGGTGVSHYDTAPVSWDGETMSGIRWKTPVPRDGNSSPVVWDDRVFITGGDEQVREVYCFSLQNGRLLWRHEVQIPSVTSGSEPMVDTETGYAAPTAACDGRRVFAIFPTGELICLDLEGRKVWAQNLGVPENHYGHSSSLITHEGILYVQFDHAEGRLMALEGRTGEMLWENKRDRLSWASPICVNTGTRQELVVVDNAKVSSFDPETGSLLWSHDCMYGEVGPSPAYADGVVYVTTEYSPVAAIQTPSGDSSRILWRWDGDLPATASPVATQNHLFLATAGGTVSCVSADSGKTVWYKDFSEGFYASPVIAGSSVYAIDRAGVMRIFQAGAEYREIGNPKLGEACVATPAVIDGILVVRGEKNLYCIEGDSND